MKYIFTIGILCLVYVSEAQNVGIGTATPIARLHVTDSNVIFSGQRVISNPANFSLPIEGAGTRFMWIANKSAFRVGTVSDTQWDAGQIGRWSTAFGNNTVASANNSTALGFLTTASGGGSLSGGTATTASGSNSVALGIETVASGSLSFAIGDSSVASGFYSIAGGFRNWATATSSIALGRLTRARSEGAFSTGLNTVASGEYSFVTGIANTSRAYASIAMGQYNDSIASSNTDGWFGNDPLLYIGNGTASARNNAMVLYKNGNMILKNPSTVFSDPGLFTVPITGTGTRMMWMPEKGAFRAGTVFGTEWDASEIGLASSAFGRANTANGYSSFAIGTGTRASGENAFSVGSSTLASGMHSVAMGVSSTASGSGSTALGFGSTASGANSTALGQLTNALGSLSTAMGNSTTASGFVATAMGYDSKATGDVATVMGQDNSARAYASLAIGRNNDSVSTSSATTWVATDPLFYIGNGTPASRHNALVVYKNGNVIAKNPTTVFTNPIGYTVPISGSGTRMMWLPEKSAFRTGTVTGNQWDAGNMGAWSFGAGYNTTAAGVYATALGANSTASGDNSTSMGAGTTASGYASTAMGQSSVANGSKSVSMGNFTTASGENSVAMGEVSVANGFASVATGYGTSARSYASVTIGRFNDSVSSSSTSSWVATDPLLYVGNGTDNNNRSNAMVVYKNGNMDISGYTQMGGANEGAPAIKMKLLTLNSANAQGALTFVNHGLNRTKIISFTCLLNYGAGDIPPSYNDVPGYEYNVQTTAIGFNVYTKLGNSINILNKPIKVLIMYVE